MPKKTLPQSCNHTGRLPGKGTKALTSTFSRASQTFVSWANRAYDPGGVDKKGVKNPQLATVPSPIQFNLPPTRVRQDTYASMTPLAGRNTPLAYTQAGRTHFHPQLVGHPKRNAVAAHEWVHRQQFERWQQGSPPATRNALEDEARHGTRALLGGQGFRVRCAASPTMRLNFGDDEAESESQADSTQTTYWVRPNDTLSKIAKRATGDARRYTELKQLNNLDSDNIDVGQGLRIPTGWNLAALGIRAPVDRPATSWTGPPYIAGVLATGAGLAGLQARIDELAQIIVKGEAFSGDDLQFLSDFYSVIYRGVYFKASEPRQRLQHYFHAMEDNGADFDLRTGIGPMNQYSTVYKDSVVVQRAQPLMKNIIRARVRGGEMQGEISSEDIAKGDPQQLSTEFVNQQGRIRGQDWAPHNKLQQTQRGHLLSEQDNIRLHYADNNFILRARWSAIPMPQVGSTVIITWFVRDLYLFRNAEELRGLGYDPLKFVTPLPVLSGQGALNVPDALLQGAEALGWARRYYSYTEWSESMQLSPPSE